jgi:hypothetical protein
MMGLELGSCGLEMRGGTFFLVSKSIFVQWALGTLGLGGVKKG